MANQSCCSGRIARWLFVFGLRVIFAAAPLTAVSGFAASAPEPPANLYFLSRLMKAFPEPRTNVLLLIADDLNCDLGCYDGPGMQTPHIDRLAKRGVRFKRAYCQYPLCSPSRSSFLTGRRPNATGVFANPGVRNTYATHFRANIPDTVTLPELFKQNGWFTARVGKVFHASVPYDIGTSSLDDFPSWDLAINPRGRDREMHDKIYSDEHDASGLVRSLGGSGFRWLADEEGEDAEHTDGIGATKAIQLLERFKREARPFFLGVGFYRPHTPFVAPKKYFDLYPRDSIALPGLSAGDRARKPAAAYDSAKTEADRATDDQRRDAIRAYRASISFMDAQVGRVVDALDGLGLAGNTVIVFMSDHGYHLGDHGLWQKPTLFARNTRVPLIIAAPGQPGNGKTSDSLVELLDLYPTLADFCGLNAPDYLDGTSLRPILGDVHHVVKDAAISQMRTRRGKILDGYAVRSGRWYYIEWDEGREGTQLFDLESDPEETTDLAAEPRYAGTKAELSSKLARIRRQ
jgi:iduronate 2-sulfatase